MLRPWASIALLSVPLPVMAEEFQPIREMQDFLTLVSERELRIGLYDLTLRVLPDGRIDGSAMGGAITGEWPWQDGYFCRQMDWGGRDIAYNCQLVEARGTEAMRFTVDQGAGESATFRLR